MGVPGTQGHDSVSLHEPRLVPRLGDMTAAACSIESCPIELSTTMPCAAATVPNLGAVPLASSWRLTMPAPPHRPYAGKTAAIIGGGVIGASWAALFLVNRSEERRVGKECRSPWVPYP